MQTIWQLIFLGKDPGFPGCRLYKASRRYRSGRHHDLETVLWNGTIPEQEDMRGPDSRAHRHRLEHMTEG